MASPGQVAMSGLGLKNQVAVGDGSAAAPSIGFSNDVNTGLYRPAGDVVGVVTGGVERMRVGSTGNVGIGTGNPGALVEIRGDLRVPFINAQWTLTGGGDITWIGTHIKWSQAVYLLPVDRSYTASGYIVISCPTSGTVTAFTGTSGSTSVTCTSNGIPLSGWQALYYRIALGQNETSDVTRFRIVEYLNTDVKITSDWILLCNRNGNDNALRWLPSQENIPVNGTYISSTGYRSWQVINKYHLSEAYATQTMSIGNYKTITMSVTGTAFVSFNCLQRAVGFSGNTSAGYWSLKKNSIKISDGVLGTRWLAFANAAFASGNQSVDNWQPLSIVWSGPVSAGDIIYVVCETVEGGLSINGAYLSITVI